MVQILATVQDGKITFDINDLLKLIQQDKLTEVEYTVEPKAMAFDTKEELDEYVKNNPKATCKGISKEDLLVFIKENIGKYLFLKEADLRWADLRGADLRGAYLRGADLRWAYLRWADLRGAYLRWADLRWADLRWADLLGADLLGADLRGADLRGAYLRGADLSEADLRRADLRRAYLREVDLSEAKYDDKTMFSEEFTIPKKMIKI